MLGCLQRKMTELTLGTFCSQLNHNNFDAISHSLQAEPPVVFLVKKGKGKHEPKAQRDGAYPGFISMKHLVVLLLPPDRMVVHCRVASQQYVAGTQLYTWVKRYKVE